MVFSKWLILTIKFNQYGKSNRKHTGVSELSKHLQN